MRKEIRTRRDEENAVDCAHSMFNIEDGVAMVCHTCRVYLGLIKTPPSPAEKCICECHPMACLTQKCQCPCHKTSPPSEKCFCGGSDLAGHIATEGHTEHKPFPEFSAEVESCAGCGGKKVLIRGKRPGDDKRYVCPICLAERMDSIREMADPYYGIAQKSRGEGSK